MANDYQRFLRQFRGRIWEWYNKRPPVQPPASTTPAAPVTVGNAPSGPTGSTQPPPVVATTPAAPVTPPADTTPQMPTDVPTGYKVLVAEDFNTDAALGEFKTKYPSAYSAYDGWKDTNGNQGHALFGIYNSSKTVTVHDGYLEANLHTENGQPYVFALTLTKFDGQTDYIVEWCASATGGPGWHAAPLEWPDNDKWSDGESDNAEADFGQRASSYWHYNIQGQESSQIGTDLGVSTADVHTYRLQTNAAGQSISVDGVIKRTSGDSRIILRGKHHHVHQLETASNITAAPTNPGIYKLYWIRVLAKV